MNKNGPVIVIEDDEDDQMLLAEVFSLLNYKNEILYFTDGNEALAYLNKEDVFPFLILSDINMPRINGLELREKVQINEQLHIKCIPYLFFTTNSTKESVIKAYSLSAQGFFQKPRSFDDLANTIRKIMEYWRECIAPSEYDQ